MALLATGIAAVFHKNYPGVNLKNLAAELINHDLPPGGNRAVLTLANGRIIVLNEAADGKIGEEEGLVFVKTGHGQLVYETIDHKINEYDAFHVISTPKAGMYKIKLPDGSKVWLNAESTFKFPVDLANRKERLVYLEGEAYLEVNKDIKRPFKIITDQQSVKVIGTHLNISNYNADRLVKTTLVKGSVHIATFAESGVPDTEVTLQGIQQAVIKDGQITTTKADTTEALSWKNGLFVFDQEPLESIMRKISRWYDVEVNYQQVDKSKLFSGKISRYEHVSAVLKLLEVTGAVHFKIMEGKIIVMN